MLSLTSSQTARLLEAAGPDAIVHLVGAGGCGMSGLGHLLLDLGMGISGSDLLPNEDTRDLAERGARIFAGHDGANVRQARPILVAYSSAVRRDNPELQAAEALQIPTVRRAVLLAALVHRQCGIAVAGMHGKTTTSALLAYALENLAANPSYAVGARVPQLRRHARLQPGSGSAARPLFVAEVDESDGTLGEFHPDYAIVLNIDAEHLDHYANLDAICRAFDHFAENTSQRIVFCADDARLAELFSRRSRMISYGFHPLADYRLVQKTAPAALGAFEVWQAGICLGEFRTGLLGEKNISNAGAVVALLHQLSFDPPAIASAIAGFRGAARRQQLVFADQRFRVFDDYGHHPAEIQATLKAFRALGGRRLLVAFQPHRYTRTQHLMEEFARSFDEADQLWLTEIYAASEAPIPGITSARLTEMLRGQGRPATHLPELSNLPQAVRAAMLPGDVVLFLGAGDITQAAHELAAQLQDETVMPNENHLAELTALLSPETPVKRDEPLARRTTMRVGGKADIYVEPASEEDLSRLVQWCAKHQARFTLLGRGSNLLIRDGGIRGVVICLCHPNFSRLEIVGDRLRCGAGVRLKTVAVESRRAGLTGLEFLEGIPGSVGGSMRMNAGAMGSWFFDVIEKIRFMDHAGQIQERPAAEVNVEYRGCPLLRNHIALGAVLKGLPAPPTSIAERMQKFSEKRWDSQPAAPSAGCIFKNPRAIPAGKLIDELGLKGTRVGGAVVSDVHGNFIINDGTATARDVLALIEVIKERARTARGIELETEVEILGDAE
jgi:UDP-N-acetylmuramate--L-alanine ligase/UDP-N-acetylenolpyruvoylglucosamine reductase